MKQYSENKPRCSFTRVAKGARDVVQCFLKEQHKESHMTLNPGPKRTWDGIDYTPKEANDNGYL